MGCGGGYLMATTTILEVQALGKHGSVFCHWKWLGIVIKQTLSVQRDGKGGSS